MMEVEERGSEISQGRLLNLEVRSAGSRVWLGPGWAFLCGAVASAGLEIGWHVLLSLLLGLLLVDSLLGTVWSLLHSDRWSLPANDGTNPGVKGKVVAPPYTLPGSFSHRLVAFLNESLERWRSTVWPRLGSTVLGLAFTSVVALLVAAVLGTGPLLLTGVAVLIAGSRFVLRGWHESVLLVVRSCCVAGLAWMIGYATFGDLASTGSDRTLLATALLWAAIYAAAFHSYQLVKQADLAKGAVLLNSAQLAAVAVLVVVRQPILAGVVALLLLPQMLLQPALFSTGKRLWYLQRVQFFTMAGTMAMAVAAAI